MAVRHAALLPSPATSIVRSCLEPCSPGSFRRFSALLSLYHSSKQCKSSIDMGTTSFSEHLEESLARSGPKTLEEIMRENPELWEESFGADTLLLLLRLDPRLRLLADGRWSIAMKEQTSRQRIMTATQDYLQQIPGNGARIKAVVDHVTADTGYDEALVRSVIVECFETSDRLVRNRLRRLT